MKNKSFFLYIFVAVYALLPFFSGTILAQSSPVPKQDTAYFVTYPKKVTARFYFSQKYTDFTMQAPAGKNDIEYRPNTSLNMGIGATYHNFSLNIAVGFGFLNNDKDKGKTKYLDLQSHAYPGKWTLDFLGQLYKGYYLQPKGFASSDPAKYYQRADAHVTLFGLAAYRILNNKRFSYNAAIVQNEWQKKSAGTLLFGGEAYYGVVKADSALVPRGMANGYPQAGINKINFISFGPGAGYAYTLVVAHHLFIMGSATANLNLGFSTESSTAGENNKTYVNPVLIYRVAAGYNSSTWNISANWVNNRLPVSGMSTADNYLLQTGNYRIILAKKINPGPKGKKMLSPIDKIFK